MAVATELRIATIMTGGVSLAVWMGGVAAEMLYLTDPEGPYASLLDRRGYDRVRIDVVTGTSAGGLNGALLAAADAWEVGPERFTNDLRTTWLEDGAIEKLLRDPRGEDPSSLLRGEEHLFARIEALLRRWRDRIEDPVALLERLLDASEPPTRVTLTTTLLDANIEVFASAQGPLREADHRGTLHFDGFDLLDDAAPARLARAARSSASYPVAFEPSFIRVGTDALDDLTNAANHTSSRYVMDGGVLVNRPFRLALEAIYGQSAIGPVGRALFYVVPRLRMTGEHGERDEQDPSHEAREQAAPTLAAVLSRTAGLPLAQTLVEDLRELEEHNRRWRHQRHDRLGWIAALLPSARTHLAEQLWPSFKQRRADAEAARILAGLARRNAMLDLDPGWTTITRGVRIGRDHADPHGETFQETTPSGQQADWRWGISAVEYLFQVGLDLVRSSRPAASLDEPARDRAQDQLSSLRRELHDVLGQVRAFRQLDRLYWEAAFADDPPFGEDVQAWAEWAEGHYRRWPDSEVATDPNTRRSILASTRRILSNGDAGEGPLTQGVARQVLLAAARRVAEVTGLWLALVDDGHLDEVDPPDDDLGWGVPERGPQPAQLAAVADMLRFALVEAAREGDGAAVDDRAGRTDHDRDAVLHTLLTLWVIQATTQHDRIEREQPIDLLAISADGPVAADPLGRSTPDAKLTGTQLGNFGAFQKRSWRANDFLWGRLDASQRIITWLSHPEQGGVASDASTSPVDGADATEQLRQRQERILVEELGHVADAVRASRDAGATHAEPAAAFLDAVGSEVDPGRTSELLGHCRIGEERLEDELGGNAFVRNAVSASAVVTQLFAGTRSGTPWIRGPARRMRWIALRLHGVVRRTHRGSGRGLLRRVGAALVWPLRLLVRSARR